MTSVWRWMAVMISLSCFSSINPPILIMTSELLFAMKDRIVSATPFPIWLLSIFTSTKCGWPSNNIPAPLLLIWLKLRSKYNKWSKACELSRIIRSWSESENLDIVNIFVLGCLDSIDPNASKIFVRSSLVVVQFHIQTCPGLRSVINACISSGCMSLFSKEIDISDGSFWLLW